MKPTRVSCPLVAAALLAASAPAFAADVWRVPSQVANIQIAINVAAPGDVILVAPGTYTQVVVADGKGVTLVADNGTVNLATLEVRNLPAGQTFTVDGFRFDLPDVFAGPDIPFIAEDCAGTLRLQDCTFLGDPGIAGNWMAGISPYAGTPGARLARCDDVAFDGCTLLGGDGDDLWDEDIQWSASSGGAALSVDDTVVSVQQSLLDGGRGGNQDDTVAYNGGKGGSGVLAYGESRVFLAGSTVLGGGGGYTDCDFFSCGYGGDGGDGIEQGSGTLVSWVRGNAFTPGFGGSDGQFPGSGDEGELIDSWGTEVRFESPYRAFTVPSPAREGQLAALDFDGQAGDGLLLFGALGGLQLPKLVHEGTFLLAPPLLLDGVFVGTLPAGGELTLPLPVPDLGPGLDAVDLHLQPVVLAGGAALLGPARVLTLLDGAF